MPGSSFSSSPVLRPTIGTFWICSAVRRALFSPESIGAISGRDVTEITSSTPPTFSVMPRHRAALAEAASRCRWLPRP